MKYRPQNGWTKARIIDALRKYVPEDGCRDETGGCVYQRGESRCALPLPLDAMERLQARHDGSWYSNKARTNCIEWVNKNVEDEP